MLLFGRNQQNYKASILQLKINTIFLKLKDNSHDSPSFGILAFPCSSASEESACNVGDLGLIPQLGRSSGEGKGYPLQYSGLENAID